MCLEYELDGKEAALQAKLNDFNILHIFWNIHLFGICQAKKSHWQLVKFFMGHHPELFFHNFFRSFFSRKKLQRAFSAFHFIAASCSRNRSWLKNIWSSVKQSSWRTGLVIRLSTQYLIDTSSPKQCGLATLEYGLGLNDCCHHERASVQGIY